MKTVIEQTGTFKSMEKFQQAIFLKKDSVNRISQSIVQINIMGYDRWKEINHPSNRDLNIIKDILNLTK